MSSRDPSVYVPSVIGVLESTLRHCPLIRYAYCIPRGTDETTAKVDAPTADRARNVQLVTTRKRKYKSKRGPSDVVLKIEVIDEESGTPVPIPTIDEDDSDTLIMDTYFEIEKEVTSSVLAAQMGREGEEVEAIAAQVALAMKAIKKFQKSWRKPKTKWGHYVNVELHMEYTWTKEEDSPFKGGTSFLKFCKGFVDGKGRTVSICDAADATQAAVDEFEALADSALASKSDSDSDSESSDEDEPDDEIIVLRRRKLRRSMKRAKRAEENPEMLLVFLAQVDDHPLIIKDCIFLEDGPSNKLNFTVVHKIEFPSPIDIRRMYGLKTREERELITLARKGGASVRSWIPQDVFVTILPCKPCLKNGPGIKTTTDVIFGRGGGGEDLDSDGDKPTDLLRRLRSMII